MNFRLILFIILSIFVLNCITTSHAYVRKDDDVFFDADTTRKPYPDSLAAVRKHIADSVKEARADIADSLKELRKDKADSTKLARAKKADSTSKARAEKTDSLKEFREHLSDSTKTARARISDSVKKVHALQAKQLAQNRKHATDSLKAYRKHISDSTASIRKKKTSKSYRDSIAHSRLAKSDSIKTARKEHIDSIKAIRTAANQQLTAARKAKSDSVKAIQKKRTDSLARIKKYKASRRYADSVQIVKHEREDSLREAREAKRDSIATVRKHTLDSAKTSRKHIADSIKVVRTHYTDSLKTVRKRRADSLLKVKESREKLAKAKEKANQEKKKNIYELKLKQKREAWSNKSMLKKGWTPFRKFTQNSFTHYNYYYNSNRKMEEAMLNMQRTKKENYDSLIGLYPFDPNRDSGLLKADMDSVIRRVSVGIQIHDPRNKWANDLFLIMGQAYYYKGNYDQSARSFRYIIAYDEAQERKNAAKNGYNNSNNKEKEQPSVLEDDHKSKLDFLKHKSVHNDAVLWLARTYSTSHQTENAGAVVSLLEGDPKLPEDLKGRVAVEKASIYLSDRNYNMASPQLAIAADDDNLPKWLRMRAAFLNGQIQQNNGQYAEAAGSFHDVLDYYPKPEMEFYARKNMAFNSLLAGTDPEEALQPLKSVLTDGKFVTYYDQVYFVMGKLAQKANNKSDAVMYYTKSVKTPKATKKQKAISFAALGDISYADGDYNSARTYYDSVSKYASSASKDSTVEQALQRAKGLQEIAAPAQVIHDQDSLLALSNLGPRDQLAAVKRYLKYLQKKYQDSIDNLDNAGLNAIAAQQLDQGADNDANNWYFSNPSNMQQGSGEFKKKWGNRPLTDNWGRASAQSQAGNTDQGDNSTTYAAGGEIDEYGLPTEEALLAKIPNKKSQKELAYKMEQRSYILLAKAYMRQLEDYKRANHTLDTLDKRYPDHNQKEEELFLRYQIAMKQNNLDKAQQYSQELLDKYPESQYATLLRPKGDESHGNTSKNDHSVNAYYDETYSLIMQHQYTEALLRIKNAQTMFDNPVYKKRFEIAQVLCYAGSGNLNLADTLISAFIKKNKEDSLIGWANSISEYIADVKKNGVPSWYNDSTYFMTDNALAALNKKKKKNQPPPPPPKPKVEIPTAYTYKPEDPHYCMVVLPGLDSRTAGLKHSIYHFDSGKYDTMKVLVDLYNSHSAIVLVKKFGNAGDAKNYLADMKSSEALKAYQPDELQLFVISDKNYLKMYYDKKIADYIKFYGSNYH